MKKEQFTKDLQKIYNELERRQAELNSYYQLMHTDHAEAQRVVDRFLQQLGLEKTPETTMAALTRIVNLREDGLEQVLRKQCNEIEIMDKKESAYLFVSRFHIDLHESLISWIEDHGLLTPFYRTLISGVDAVGVAMSGWQSAWTSHIINGINREFYSYFNGDEEKIFEKLRNEKLLDLDTVGAIGDRCYSVLHKQHDESYKRVAYAEAFAEEVAEILDILSVFIDTLSGMEDEVYHQKNEWINYLQTIHTALGHTNPDELIGYWAQVDRAWMRITTPIQIGHPFEYYEDHYRKAVALEWDLRIVNPSLQTASSTRQNIEAFGWALATKINTEEAKTIITKNIMQINKTQLYIGQPMLYYGAEFNGLFSAQVVPNDETVSAEMGKKIFAYADFVLASKKAKPIMRLTVETFGKDFVKSQRELMENEPQLWNEIYDISTIGHEFGHILWIDSDTESRMNGTGQFKNIEEFKATAGGLMAFFYQERENLKRHIIDDLVSRAVGLMAWREVGEVLPYYCEGLIHLEILFGSGVLHYHDKTQTLFVNYSNYNSMRMQYIKTYEKLAKHYLAKKDAYIYLSDYVTRYNGVYLPIKEQIHKFVEHYYARYKEIGQETITLD